MFTDGATGPGSRRASPRRAAAVTPIRGGDAGQRWPREVPPSAGVSDTALQGWPGRRRRGRSAGLGLRTSAVRPLRPPDVLIRPRAIFARAALGIPVWVASAGARETPRRKSGRPDPDRTPDPRWPGAPDTPRRKTRPRSPPESRAHAQPPLTAACGPRRGVRRGRQGPPPLAGRAPAPSPWPRPPARRPGPPARECHGARGVRAGGGPGRGAVA